MHPGDDFSMECPFPIFSSHVGFQGIHNSSIVQFAKYHFRKMSHPRVSLHDHSGCYSAIHFAYPQDHRRMDETKHLMPDFRLNKEGRPALKFESGWGTRCALPSPKSYICHASHARSVSNCVVDCGQKSKPKVADFKYVCCVSILSVLKAGLHVPLCPSYRYRASCLG